MVPNKKTYFNFEKTSRQRIQAKHTEFKNQSHYGTFLLKERKTVINIDSHQAKIRKEKIIVRALPSFQFNVF